MKYFLGINQIWLKLDETRKEYINSLREADNGNIKPLIEFAKN